MMRFSRFAVASLSLALLGAGCGPITSPKIAQPISDAFPIKPIAQSTGFGALPRIPTPQLKPGSRGSVRLLADVPTVPTNISVLRVNDGRPDENLLRNASDALGIPSGLLGTSPVGRNITVTWDDASKISWSASADGRRIEFVDASHPTKSLTVSQLPTASTAVQLALAFLEEHGVSLKRYGTPYLEQDWTSWWMSQKEAGHCMSAQTLSTLRSLGISPSSTPRDFPALPSSGCVNPEFPSQMIVALNTTQDGQGIFNDNGMVRVGARIIVDAAAGRVVAGSFTFAADPYRSDYPGISQDEAEARMVRGGQGGTPNGNVAITTIRFEWYAIESTQTPPTRFLIPALVGEGTIEYPDKTTAPYRIVVPLAKQ